MIPPDTMEFRQSWYRRADDGIMNIEEGEIIVGRKRDFKDVNKKSQHQSSVSDYHVNSDFWRSQPWNQLKFPPSRLP